MKSLQNITFQRSWGGRYRSVTAVASEGQCWCREQVLSM